MGWNCQKVNLKSMAKKRRRPKFNNSSDSGLWEESAASFVDTSSITLNTMYHTRVNQPAEDTVKEQFESPATRAVEEEQTLSGDSSKMVTAHLHQAGPAVNETAVPSEETTNPIPDAATETEDSQVEPTNPTEEADGGGEEQTESSDHTVTQQVGMPQAEPVVNETAVPSEVTSNPIPDTTTETEDSQEEPTTPTEESEWEGMEPDDSEVDTEPVVDHADATMPLAKQNHSKPSRQKQSADSQKTKRGPKTQITAGLMKLSKSDLERMKWEPLAYRNLPKLIPVGKTWIKALSMIRARKRIWGRSIIYDAVLHYIHEFFGNYLDPMLPDKSSEALHNKTVKAKQKMGWQEPAERIEKCGLPFNADIDLLMVLIKSDHQINARDLMYDAMVYYVNKFYKEFVPKNDSNQ